MLTRAELIGFLRRSKLAVVATVAPGELPQAAVVGFAVSDDLELVFDTLTTTRKFGNLATNPHVAAVVGWDEATAQLEGIADVPTGPELDRLKAVYFAVYPDGRDREQWANITWVRVRITWARLSDFAKDPPRIEELA